MTTSGGRWCSRGWHHFFPSFGSKMKHPQISIMMKLRFTSTGKFSSKHPKLSSRLSCHHGLMRRSWRRSCRTFNLSPISSFRVINQQIVEHFRLVSRIEFAAEKHDFGMIWMRSYAQVGSVTWRIDFHFFHFTSLTFFFFDGFYNGFNIVL